MLIKPEYSRASVFAPVAPYPLEYSDTIMKGMSEDMNISVFPVDKLPVHPYLCNLLNHLKLLNIAHCNLHFAIGLFALLFCLCLGLTLNLSLNLPLFMQAVMVKDLCLNVLG